MQPKADLGFLSVGVNQFSHNLLVKNSDMDGEQKLDIIT